MITQQERIIRESQGYDIGFEHNGKKYWINSSTWNAEKKEKLFQETGLRSFKECYGKHELVIYNPQYFRVIGNCLHYCGCVEDHIPQPINMSSAFRLFYDCRVETLDLSDWDMSNVLDVEHAFQNSRSLLSINLNNWDTTNLLDAAYMFAGCFSLKSIDLSNWNVQSLKYMDYMFYDCTNLSSLKLTNWKIKDEISIFSMFETCYALQDITCTDDDKLNLERIIAKSNNKSTIEQLNLF